MYSRLDVSDRPIKESRTPRVDVLFLSLTVNMVDVKKIVDEKRIARRTISEGRVFR